MNRDESKSRIIFSNYQKYHNDRIKALKTRKKVMDRYNVYCILNRYMDSYTGKHHYELSIKM